MFKFVKETKRVTDGVKSLKFKISFTAKAQRAQRARRTQRETVVKDK